MKRLVTLVTASALACLPPAAVQANAGCAHDAMLVFDGSGSMGEIGFDTGDAPRIAEARAAIRWAMPDITPYRRVGLLIYGPGTRDACSNINLQFGPRANAAPDIIAGINGLRPGGLTPLTDAVFAAAQVLGSEGVIVLVTDGNETCGGRPCSFGDYLAANNPGLTVHVVGFRAEADFFAWNNPEAKSRATRNAKETVAKCLSDKTGGVFVSTETVPELVEALKSTLGCPLIGNLPENQRLPVPEFWSRHPDHPPRA